ncbi:uncharacterized protein BX664DRAFT_104771 [Halteromyces radiatus]|uniref:uncharacterized protein n=1 Tax=Halteromyces radiatus TaxID=101107 RepID=UPI00222024DD|nr:uncharacterized protein BX664DRAFT_104771 [Halteromyces radiatus]KAI8093311.1 hypothetical protein BX664DRAFT_104771 [Halteromyces radiatus]
MINSTIKGSELVSQDPSQLFTQFNPTLYFDQPQLVTDLSLATDVDTTASWYTIIEQLVPSDRTTFWETIRRWTAEPQFVIPPIEKANIISTTTNDTNHTEDNQDNLIAFETVVRQLIPKRKSKDTILSETIRYYEYTTKGSVYEGRVIYEPSMTKPTDILPFYYPKVRAYSFTYTSSNIDGDSSGILRLQILPMQLRDDPKITDLKMQKALQDIIHKLFKWCIQARIGYKKKAHHDSLVSKDIYVNKYQEIKTRYADVLVRAWTEKTDPKKFVYEDIAIASYLICLWLEEEKKTKRKPNFVDLGCGNGLLTYLLTSEGYDGYGVDMANRRIWEKLSDGKPDMLKVEALYPATVTYEADWIIGNHADELVPWIPIISTKSGNHCKFLVIPCCMYGLDGSRKLSLMNEPGGKYRAYTNYIKSIANQCGFHCEEDYLRIPSTKNIALIGRQRLHMVNPKDLEAIQAPGIGFTLRRTDREKEELRRLDSKRAKIVPN